MARTDDRNVVVRRHRQHGKSRCLFSVLNFKQYDFQFWVGAYDQPEDSMDQEKTVLWVDVGNEGVVTRQIAFRAQIRREHSEFPSGATDWQPTVLSRAATSERSYSLDGDEVDVKRSVTSRTDKDEVISGQWDTGSIVLGGSSPKFEHNLGGNVSFSWLGVDQ